MKRKKAVLGLASLLLFSCSLTQGGLYEFGPLNEEPFESIEKEGYARQGAIPNFDYQNGSISNFSLSSVFAGSGNKFIPSVGERKLLVVPVDFADYPASNRGASAIYDIESAFFGSNSRNQYESVASYFDKSSLGRLHLSGHVASSWYRSPFTYASLKSQTGSAANKRTLTDIYNGALAWFKANNPDFDLSPYLVDGAVPMYLVYSAPYSGEETGSGNRNSFFWAFTINSPAPISWSGLGMLNLNSSKSDAHTFIHEVGHLLGLDDYYSSNTYSGPFSPVSPLGRMDMMDCSLGDHNCFSKYLLGWGRPYVPTRSCSIYLHPSAGSNEFILLSPSWNGNPFDEYLAIEYYTPNGLNFVDSAYREDESMRLFGKSGIKVYHVDARLGVYENQARFSSYLSHDTVKPDGAFFGLTKSNILPAPSGGFVDTSNCLIQMLDKSSGSAKLAEYYISGDHVKDLTSGVYTGHLRDSLFYEGDSFGITSFNDLSFHNGQRFGCSFSVAELKPGYAKIDVKF